MKTKLETLELKTTEKQQLINITSRVKDAVSESGIRNGMIGLADPAHVHELSEFSP